MHYNILTGEKYSGEVSRQLEAAAKERQYDTGQWVLVEDAKGREFKLNEEIDNSPVRVSVRRNKKEVSGMKHGKEAFSFYNKEQLELSVEEEQSLRLPIEKKKSEEKENKKDIEKDKTKEVTRKKGVER